MHRRVFGHRDMAGSSTEMMVHLLNERGHHFLKPSFAFPFNAGYPEQHQASRSGFPMDFPSCPWGVSLQGMVGNPPNNRVWLFAQLQQAQLHLTDCNLIFASNLNAV